MMEKMLDFVRQMEGRSSRRRMQCILDYLEHTQRPYEMHAYWEWLKRTANIVLTKPGQSKQEILILAHYDVYHGNPGANDNASSIAVLLDVFEHLAEVSNYCTIRAIMFDDEEQSPLRPRPCLGSRKYVRRFGIENAAGAFCLELCGLGDTIGIWPVSENDSGSPLLKASTCAFKAQGIPHAAIARLPGFTSDFMPFRRAGLTNAFCFSAVPSAQRKELLAIFSAPYIKLLFSVELRKILGLGKGLPDMIRCYHTKQDTAEFLSEDALKMMSRGILAAIKAYDDNLRAQSQI